MVGRAAMALALLLGGCRSKGTPPRAAPAASASVDEGRPRDGGVLRVHMEAEPPTLNPLVEHDAWTMWLGLGAIYDPLVRQDPQSGAFSPSLAARWEEPVGPGGRTLRFLLREGVTWHDGRPLSADDVVATLARLRAPGASAELRANFDDLLSVEKTGPREVVLRFSGPAPLALQSLARLAILPAHALGPVDGGDPRARPLSRAPVGTGPFRFVEWRAGERIVLERAPGYWGPRPHLDRIELAIVRDREAAWELLRRGGLDLLWQLTPSQIERATGAVTSGLLGAGAPPSTARIVSWRLPRYSFVVWNLARPGLGDRRVRRALTLLTDRARYLKVVFRGRAAPVTGPYPLDSAAYDASLAPWPFDPAGARALLDQAGVIDRDGDGVRELPDGTPLRLTFLLTAGSPTLEPLVTMMQEELRKAGVALAVAPTDWAVLLDRLRKHAFDAAALQWVMQPVQDNFSLFHSSQTEQGQNYGGFQSAEADRLLEALRATPPGPERVRLDRALHRLIHEEQPYTFLGCPGIDSLVAGRVHGYHPDYNGLGLPGIWVDD